jgi:hypothetical protein
LKTGALDLVLMKYHHGTTFGKEEYGMKGESIFTWLHRETNSNTKTSTTTTTTTKEEEGEKQVDGKLKIEIVEM